MGSQSGMDSLQLCFPCMYVVDIIVVLVGRASSGVVSVMTVVYHIPHMYMYTSLPCIKCFSDTKQMTALGLLSTPYIH